MPRRPHRALAFLLLAASLSGCSAFARPLVATAEGPAYVFFTNRSQDQADVYVVLESGQNERLGTVYPGRTEKFTLREDLLTATSNPTIVARLLAKSNIPRTPPLSIQSGDALQVTLGPAETVLTVQRTTPPQ